MCWLAGFADPDIARRIYGEDFPLIDITSTPDVKSCATGAWRCWSCRSYIRQRDLMDLHEQLVRLLGAG